MILRSASVPTLGAVVGGGDHCDWLHLSYTPHRNRTVFTINTASRAGRFSKPSFPMHRACSDTDLQGLLSAADVTEDHNAGEISSHPKFHCPVDKFSIIEERDQRIFSPAGPTLTERGFQSRSRVCSGMILSHISTPCAYDSNEVESIGAELSASSKADYLIADSEGDLGGRGGYGSGHDGSGGAIVSSHGDSDPTDLRYRKLLQLDPENSLLLRNYAQYLSEIKHDYNKSEEYYERAILACPSDGEVLSTYAKHMWDVHKDVERAGSYFDQAVKAAPDDCYVLASHASFLWQSEEDEEFSDASQSLFPSSNSICTTALSLTASA